MAQAEFDSTEETRKGPGRPLPWAWSDDRESVSLLRVANVLLRHRKVVATLPLLGASLLVLAGLLSPPTYTAVASFVPQTGERDVSELAGLAARFGVSLPLDDAGRSPSFYMDLLRTREVLSAAVATEYGSGSDGAGAADLVELFDVSGETRPIRRERAIEELGERMEVTVSPETGIVRLAVTTPWPEVSRQVARRLLELVDRFDRESRVSQASAERRFVEGRLASAEAELRAAEARLRGFLERNRRYENSPQLRFEHDGLQRQVALRQQLYASLAESYEQARIEEVRNTPVITPVQPPTVPAEPDPRNLPIRALLGLILGFGLALAWALGRELLRRAGQEAPEERAELARLRREAGADLSRLWRRLGRRRGDEGVA